MRMFNCDMYYANVDQKFRGVFYYYKNNTIYIDEKKRFIKYRCLSNTRKYTLLAELWENKQKGNRAGICQFKRFKIFALGINEAIVQYITKKH